MSRNRAWPEQIRLALLFLVDIGHPVLILSGVIPLICCFDPGRNEKVLLPVFLAGLCMLPFAALIRGSVWKVKRYWQYFLVMAAAVLGAWTFSRLFAAHYMEGAGRLWFPPLYAALVWFYSVDMGLWRRREYERQRARIENDIEWRMNGVLFERPSLIWLVYFVICYLAGLRT